MICPPDSTAAWLGSGLRDFGLDELVEYRGRAYWPHFKIWFWHGFLDRSQNPPQLDIREFVDRELSKLRYQREVFQSLDVNRTCFILSNTQNNLSTEVFDSHELELYKFDAHRIDSLETELNRFFGQTVNLQIVTRKDRCASELLARDNVHLLPLDQSEWKGDKSAWEQLLHSFKVTSE